MIKWLTGKRRNKRLQAFEGDEVSKTEDFKGNNGNSKII